MPLSLETLVRADAASCSCGHRGLYESTLVCAGLSPGAPVAVGWHGGRRCSRAAGQREAGLAVFPGALGPPGLAHASPLPATASSNAFGQVATLDNGDSCRQLQGTAVRLACGGRLSPRLLPTIRAQATGPEGRPVAERPRGQGRGLLCG